MAQLFSKKEQEPIRSPKPGETQLLPETMWAQEPMPSGIPPENTVVVTISRQFGSGGSDIARLIAKEADLNYVDQNIITDVASQLGVDTQPVMRQDERTRGTINLILDAIQASSPFTVNYHPMHNPDSARAQAKEALYLHLTQKVILEIATRGNAVIVGRGAQFLLHNAPRTLHAYIFAPMPYRIENVMKQFQLNHTQSAHLIEQRDYEQSNYLHRFYGSDGHQPSLYHLLINTGLFSIELATNLIHQSLPIVKEIG